jgi:hypothetical protein
MIVADGLARAKEDVMDNEEREAKLEAMIAKEITHGWKLESRTRFNAVLVAGHRPNHVLHLLLTVFTLGLWLPVWLLLSITQKEQRKQIAV